MAEIKEIRNLPVGRPVLENREQVAQAIQELSLAIGEIAAQWNAALYPLLASLPGGRVRRSREERIALIEPIANGFDGSQVYLDQTARAGELGGLLHDGTRPRTIKEVMVSTSQQLGARLNELEALVAGISNGGEAYDDTQLRSWIIRLAAESWDPDEIAQGATLNAANFSGSPTKVSEFSLNQRDKFLREVLGIDGETLDFVDLSDNSAIAATNYISEETNVIDALVVLDSVADDLQDQIDAISVGSTDLQEAYDNTATGKEIDVADEPIHILVSDTGTQALLLTGDLCLYGDFDSTNSPLCSIGVDSTGDAVDGVYYLRLKSEGVDQIATFSHRKGSGVGTAVEVAELSMGVDAPNSAVRVGHSTGEHIYLYNYAGAGAGNGMDINGAFVLNVTDGTMEIVVNNNNLNIMTGTGGITMSGFQIGSLAESINLTSNAGAVVDVDADGVSLSGDDIAIESTDGDVTIAADTDVDIDADGAVTIAAGTTLDLDGNSVAIDSVVNTVVTAGGLISLGAGAGVVVVGAVDVSLTSTTADVNLTAGDDVTITAADVVSINSVNDLKLNSDTTITLNSDDNWVLRTDNDGPIGFTGLNARWTQGLSFIHATTITAGVATGSVGIGGLYFLNDGYHGDSLEASGLQMEVGSYKVTKAAPTIIDGDLHGESVDAGVGKPDIDTIYKENVVKAKCRLTIQNSLYTDSSITMIPQNFLGDGYNFFIDEDEAGPDTDSLGSWWGNDVVNMKFLTAMPNDEYSVNITIEAKPGYIYVPVLEEGSCNVNGFRFRVLAWNVGVSTDWGFDATGFVTAHIQVI